MIALLLLFSSFISADADSTDYENIYEHAYLKEAEGLLDREKYKSALPIYINALQKFTKQEVYEGVCAANIKIGAIHYIDYMYDSSAIYLNKALHVACTYLSCNPRILSDIYFQLGKMHFYNYQPDSAIFYHQKSLNLRLELYETNDKKIAGSYNALGDVYRYSFLDYHTAEEYYIKALEIYNKWYPKLAAKTYYDLGTTARLKGDPDEALSYINEAIRRYKKENEENYYRFSLCNHEIANCYFQKFEFAKAIESSIKAIDYLKKGSNERIIQLSEYYTNLSGIWIDSNQPDSAIFYLKKAENLIDNHSNTDKLVLSFIYQQLGNAYLKRDVSAAGSYYKKGVKIMSNTFGDNHPQIASYFLSLGKYYEELSDFNKASLFYEKAFNILGYSQNDSIGSEYKNPSLELITVLDRLGTCNHKIYLKTGNIDNLKKGLSLFVELDKLIRLHRHSFFRESTQLSISADVKDNYENAIACAFDLFELEPSNMVHEALFQFMENNRAWVLASALHKAEVYGSLGVADTILRHEQQLHAKLAFYRSELDYYLSEKDSLYIDLTRARIFELEQEMQKLLININEIYPTYYESKYKKTPITLKELKEFAVHNESHILEYFAGDSAIYLLFVDGKTGTTTFYKSKSTSGIYESIDSLVAYLNRTINFSNLNQDYTIFKESSYEINKELVKPLLARRDDKIQKLKIIPDGKLSSIPFEALISNIVNTSNPDYSILDYLIKKYQISYSYSAQLAVSQPRKIDKTPEGMLIFSYGPENAESHTQILGTKTEADFISSIVSLRS